MAASRPAQALKRRRGFSLIELLIVIFILGITLMFGLSGLNSAFKRQKLASTAGELTTLAGRALTEMQNRNASTFLVFGKYVTDVGTDVAVVVDVNGNGTLDEDIDPNTNSLFEDAAANIVVWRTRVPPEIFLSKASPDTGVLWAAATEQVELRITDADPVTADVFSRALLCDFRGRTLIPGATPTMIRGPARVQLTHRDMVSGSLEPFVTFTVSIAPLFKASLARVP